MSATLKLKRDGVGFELRRGTIDITVDGKKAGAIDYHETTEIPLEAGQHTLKLQTGRYTSQDETFDVADGDTVNYQCHAVMFWGRYLVSLVAPDQGIALKRA